MPIGIAMTVIATLLYLTARIDGFPLFGPLMKMTASTGFLITALAAGAPKSRFGIVLFVGLIFSWFGDLFLIGHGPNYFLAGLVAFLLGHLSYSAAYVIHQSRLKVAALALLLLLVPAYFLAQWILPHVKDPLMRGPVILYMAVITVMLALAVGCAKRPGGIWMASGAFLFYLSDICVARGAFVAPGEAINSRIGLPLYFGGQLLLAVSLAYVTQQASAPRERPQPA